MNLYIQIENGLPINHPAFEDNLIQAFGKVPDHWEEFVRVEKPLNIGIYQICSEEPIYQKIKDSLNHDQQNDLIQVLHYLENTKLRGDIKLGNKNSFNFYRINHIDYV